MTRPGLRDQGAVALIVAMLFGTFVLLGCAALTLDVGNINLDRRQLQNGADSVALAVAKDCANTGTCAPNDPTLQTVANGNAADGATEIRRVDEQTPAICGNAPGLDPCPAAAAPNSGNLQECPASSLPASTKYVRVYTETKNAAGRHLLPYSFGAAITGAGSGANQQACASVAWGPAGSVPSAFPVTFSYCDWQAATGANPLATPPVLGTYVAPPAAGQKPGYGAAPNTPWPAAASEVTLYTAKKPGSCPSWNGHNAPGSFGTLDNISCNSTIVNGWVQGVPGNSDPCGSGVLSGQRGTIVYVPIFDCFTGTKGSFANCTDGKNHDWFHISGYAPFYLTGFYFSSTKAEDGGSIFPPDGNSLPCSNGARCVSGWFTTSTLQTTIDTSGAPGFGTSVIQVAG